MTQNVRVTYTKWGGHPHWEFNASQLGEDEHGLWLAMPPGTFMSRSGVDVVLRHPSVLLLPGTEPYTAMFMTRTREEEPNPPVVYVDVTTIPTFDGRTVEAVDLDLDVVRFFDSSVLLEDEDEFEEHRVRYGYPASVADGARATAVQLVSDLTHRTEPFGIVADSWLRRVTGSPHGHP